MLKGTSQNSRNKTKPVRPVNAMIGINCHFELHNSYIGLKRKSKYCISVPYQLKITKIRLWVKIQWRIQAKGGQEWDHEAEPKAETVNMKTSVNLFH